MPTRWYTSSASNERLRSPGADACRPTGPYRAVGDPRHGAHAVPRIGHCDRETGSGFVALVTSRLSERFADRSALSRWADALADLPAGHRTVVCGHTHMPFVRLVNRLLVVNSGSIGMPYGRAGGSWALLHNGTGSLRHTRLDVDAAVKAVVAGSTYPQRQAWVDEYVRAANSDADAIAAFTPQGDRPDVAERGADNRRPSR